MGRRRRTTRGSHGGEPAPDQYLAQGEAASNLVLTGPAHICLHSFPFAMFEKAQERQPT